MSDLVRKTPGSIDFERDIAKRDEQLDEQARELTTREFSLIERYISNPKLAKLAERLRTDELQQKLDSRLTAMRLADEARLNALRTQLRGLLGVNEARQSADLTDQVARISAELQGKLADQLEVLTKQFEERIDRLDEITNPKLRERQERRLFKLLDQQEEVVDTLIASSIQNIKRLADIYQAQSLKLED